MRVPRPSYHVAASLDGFIAHPNGTFGGFWRDEDVIADFLAELGSFGTVLVGRKTYEVGSGIPLFGALNRQPKLTLRGTKARTCGVVLLTYDVERAG